MGQRQNVLHDVTKRSGQPVVNKVTKNYKLAIPLWEIASTNTINFIRFRAGKNAKIALDAVLGTSTHAKALNYAKEASLKGKALYS